MINKNDPAAFSFNKRKVLSNEKIEDKAQELLSQLTLDEKIEMMDGDTPFWQGMADIADGGYYKHPWYAGVISRLGIPGIRFMDGPRGVIIAGATTFPVAMARGATWDTDLEERIGEAMGRELRVFGGNLFGGICVNLLRHPAGGRAQETFGEDPMHVGEMGSALVRGVQKHAMACVKHFALNSMENARFTVDVSAGKRALHEIYLAHFKRIVDEGVAAVMSAYNSVNGEWCGQNKELLSDILKDKWQFKGFVLTDFMFGMRDAKKAALAGQDLEMPFWNLYHRNLKSLVEKGDVPVEKINDSVLRMLRTQMRFVKKGDYRRKFMGCEKHRALAREAVEKSIVLLKNDNNLLPLKNIKRLTVIGRLANIPNTGDGGSSNTRPDYVITPLEGIQEALKKKSSVVYDNGNDPERAKAAARTSDAVVIVVGYTHEDEGEFISPDSMKEFADLFPKPGAEDSPNAGRFIEGDGKDQLGTFQPGGDRIRLTLRPEDEELIKTVTGVNSRVIVAIMGGSAVIMEQWKKSVPAIIMLWYPGMEGGHAFADILFGKVSPGGKLPFVIPKKAEDLPFFDRDAKKIEYDLWYGYRKFDRDRITPAFPFGFGLNYTAFSYGNLNLKKNNLKFSDALEVSLDVSNTGKLAGEEIVQLYISPIGSSVERAPKELKDFTRVAVKPGKSRAVRFVLPVARLAYYNETLETFTVESIEYELMIGGHSLDEKALKARFKILNG